MVSMDIFHSDPFKAITLTMAVEKVPYVPDGLESLGIFVDEPIRTEALAVEERAGKLTLIPMSDRGAPATERTTEKRKMRYFGCPRLRHGDTLYAREIAAIREFGRETELMQAQKEIMRRMVGPTGLRSNLRYTQEFHKLAAVQGKLLDTDGSVKYDWFAEFGITANPIVPFNLLANTARSIRPVAANIVRQMARKAAGAFIPGKTRVIALCGDQFYDNFVTHTDVEKTYANWAAAEDLRKGTAFKTFPFAEIEWVNYRGTDDTLVIAAGFTNGSAAITGLPTGLANGMDISGPGIPIGSVLAAYNSGAGTANLSGGNFNAPTGTYNVNVGSGIALMGGGAISIPSNKAIFFPAGAPGIFQRGLAPGESFDVVQDIGRPEYAQLIFDKDRNEWIRAEMSVYPLHICTRPEVLFTGTMDSIAD